MDWPIYGVSYTRESSPTESKYFNIEGEIKRHYADFPNHITQQFLSKILGQITQKFPENPDKQYEKAMELKEKYNNRLRERGIDFLTYVIVKRKSGKGRDLFGIQVRIYEEKFKKFLDEFSKSSNLTIEEKYQYLMNSRFSTLLIESKSERTSKESVKNLSEKVGEIAERDIGSIEQKIDRIASKVENWQKELQKYWADRKLWKFFGTYPTTLLYLMEMESILNNMKKIVGRGSAPPCYREMRKLLENLSWAIFDDFLFINSKYYKYQKENHPPANISLPRSFQDVNKKWYKWDQNNKNKSHHFDKRLKALRNKIFDHCKNPKLCYHDKYGVGKGEIKVELKREMSYPLYISLAGTEIDKSKEVEEFVYPFKPENLKPLVRFSLKNVLRSLKGGRRTGKLDKRFLNKISESTVNNNCEFICPPFPSNGHIIAFLHDVWHTNFERELNEFYKQYSFFVHSYLHSWQVYPYFSVLDPEK